MTRIFLLLAIIWACICQQFLPKQSEFLPINDLFMSDIARSGKTDFWKVDGNYWSTIISAYPVRPSAVTKVTILLVSGNTFMIGCGKGQFSDILRTQFVGQFANSVSYYTQNGQKHKNGDPIDYASPASVGDKITMTIDLRPYENTVSFAKNGLPMGIAFSGLNHWGQDIYIYFSLHIAGQRIKIIDYEVIQ